MPAGLKCILVAVDFSDVTARVLDEASRLAAALPSPIHLIHVEDVEGRMMMFDGGSEDQRESLALQPGGERQFLLQCESTLHERGVKVTSALLRGEPVEKIVQTAKLQSAEMIVIGSHGHGSLYHLLAGSVGEGVLKQAPCPVLVVRSKTPE